MDQDLGIIIRQPIQNSVSSSVSSSGSSSGSSSSSGSTTADHNSTIVNMAIGNDQFMEHYYANNSLEDNLTGKRFADNDQLKYSLRSIELYAPWIRNIYLVTNGQVPTWLNVSHPQIHLITHQVLTTNYYTYILS